MSKATEHNNVVIFDDRGIPSIMCRFERPKDAAETPAIFKIGEYMADAIYISKYPNVIIKGRAYSLPMLDPAVNVTFDGAVTACIAKGEGWHLMTAVEWEYLLNQSREKDTMPHGNTDYGTDYYHKEEKADCDGCGYGRSKTGSGPATWNHDNTIYGVSDLNGNVWEWLAGLRLLDGAIEYIPNNDAALTGWLKDSTAWQQLRTARGPVRVEVEAGEITITDRAAAEDYTPDYDGTRIADLKIDLQEVPQALKDLGIVSDKRAESELKTYVYFDATEGEWLPLRGSAFTDTSASGASALNLDNPRSGSYDDVGFRSAFYEINGKLITE